MQRRSVLQRAKFDNDNQLYMMHLRHANSDNFLVSCKIVGACAVSKSHKTKGKHCVDHRWQVLLSATDLNRQQVRDNARFSLHKIHRQENHCPAAACWAVRVLMDAHEIPMVPKADHVGGSKCIAMHL
jgi:hypothetical protein